MNGLEALQGALAAEHAVLWGYDLVGATVSAAVQPTVKAVQAAHETRRDALEAAVRERKAEPVTAQADYELPFPVTTPAAALKLAVLLENRCAAAWRYLLESGPDRPLRQLALDALIGTAVQATRWTRQQGAPLSQALPGSTS